MDNTFELDDLFDLDAYYPMLEGVGETSNPEPMKGLEADELILQDTQTSRGELLNRLIDAEWKILTLKQELQNARSMTTILQSKLIVAESRVKVAEATTKLAESKNVELNAAALRMSDDWCKYHKIWETVPVKEQILL